MAQRATVLVEKDAPASRRISAEMAAPPPRAIPVDLRKVVAPYRNQGRLSIRIERMPALARFSAGRNNGDNSWSFTLDELEDLLYLPGVAFDEPQMLAVRIIALDSTDAATIAVLDYEISPEISIAMVEPTAPNTAALAQLRGLRDELAGMALRLAAREADLETAKAETRRAEAQKSTGDEKNEIERLNGELAGLREQLAGRDADIAKLQSAMLQATARQERNLQDALETWKAGEAARLEAAQAHWKTQLAQMRAELQEDYARAEAQSRGAAAAQEQIAQQRLRDELASLRQTLAAREGELGQSRAALVQAEREIGIVRATADREARERFAAGLGEAVGRYEAAEAALGKMRMRAGAEHAEENAVLRNEINTLRTVLASRENELSQFRPMQEGRSTWADGAEHPDNGGFVFAVLAFAIVAMTAVLFYPQIVATMPYDWQVELATLTGQVQLDTADATGANAPPAPAQPKSVVLHDVNLRADASANSGVLATLQPGIEVAEIRKQGNWTLVEARAASTGQKAQQGWVYNSFLKHKDMGTKTRGS